MNDKLTIIIPAGGLGRRMRSYGPKCLVDVGNGVPLLQRQLVILTKLYPAAELIVVLGFEADKVYRVIPPHIRVAENDLYETTNVTRSICLALRCAGGFAQRILIVYGDLVFNEKLFLGLELTSSFVVTNSDSQMREYEVGLNIVGDNVTQFSYGLPTKWAQIVYLQGQELVLFRQTAYSRDNGKLYGFEILNKVLEHGGKLRSIEPPGMAIAEVDTSKDIEAAQLLVKKDVVHENSM